MPNDNGKVIVSLLAGATAGIVAGLLLAPETGDDARQDLRDSSQKWWDALRKQTKGAFSKLQGQPSVASANPDQHAADALLTSMSTTEPGDLATPAGAGNGRSVAGDEESAPDLN